MIISAVQVTPEMETIEDARKSQLVAIFVLYLYSERPSESPLQTEFAVSRGQATSWITGKAAPSKSLSQRD